MLSALGACVTIAGSAGAGYCFCREKSARARQLFLRGGCLSWRRAKSVTVGAFCRRSLQGRAGGFFGRQKEAEALGSVLLRVGGSDAG